MILSDYKWLIDRREYLLEEIDAAMCANDMPYQWKLYRELDDVEFDIYEYEVNSTETEDSCDDWEIENADC